MSTTMLSVLLNGNLCYSTNYRLLFCQCNNEYCRHLL